MHTHTHITSHRNTHIYHIEILRCTYIHRHTYIHTCTWIHTRANTYIISIYTHRRTDTYLYTHAHTHGAHTQPARPEGSSGLAPDSFSIFLLSTSPTSRRPSSFANIKVENRACHGPGRWFRRAAQMELESESPCSVL